MRPLFFSWGYLAPLMDFVQHTLETAPFWRGSKPIFNQFFLAFFQKILKIFALLQVSWAYQTSHRRLNGKNESFVFKLWRQKQPFHGSFKPHGHYRFAPPLKDPPDLRIFTD